MIRRLLLAVTLLAVAGIVITIVALRASRSDTSGSPESATSAPVASDRGEPTGSVSEPPAATATPAPTGEPRRPNPDSFRAGAAVLLFQPYGGWEEDIVRWYAYLAKRGVNALSLNFPIYTDGVTSNRVYTTRGTPSDENLRFAISQAQRAGFTVFLRPLLDPDIDFQGGPEDWRGTLRPDSIPTWFSNYGELMLHYARLAQEEKVEMFSVGVELISLATSQPQEWKTLIADVRTVYSGQVTYSANWDEVSRVDFWEDVDVVAIDAFFEMDVPDPPSVDELVSAWSRETYVGVPLDIIQGVHDTWGKPIIFAEFGMPAKAGAEQHPWEGAADAPATEQDLTAQANYYRAAFIATGGPLIGGYYSWAVTPSEDPANGSPRTGYSPWGKPAEAVISEYYRARSP